MKELTFGKAAHRPPTTVHPLSSCQTIPPGTGTLGGWREGNHIAILIMYRLFSYHSPLSTYVAFGFHFKPRDDVKRWRRQPRFHANIFYIRDLDIRWFGDPRHPNPTGDNCTILLNASLGTLISSPTFHFSAHHRPLVALLTSQWACVVTVRLMTQSLLNNGAQCCCAMAAKVTAAAYLATYPRVTGGEFGT